MQSIICCTGGRFRLGGVYARQAGRQAGQAARLDRQRLRVQRRKNLGTKTRERERERVGGGGERLRRRRGSELSRTTMTASRLPNPTAKKKKLLCRIASPPPPRPLSPPLSLSPSLSLPLSLPIFISMLVARSPFRAHIYHFVVALTVARLARRRRRYV